MAASPVYSAASAAALAELPQATRDRIAHIDFTLFFRGEAVRADLISRFNTAPAQATKDFTLYRKLAPDNIQYDSKRKIHLRSANFRPLFAYDPVRTLATLSQGHGDGFAGKIQSPFACEAPYHLNKPCLNTVAKITQAMHNHAGLRITYVSLSSGETTREMVPHTLVDNGLRWHLRAYDRKHQAFRDFVLTRIKAAEILDTPPTDNERVAHDRQWHRFVELELVPHPRIAHSQAIELDYGMVAGVIRVEIRAATAGYLLRLWNVDCSAQHSLSGHEYQLWLRNQQALYGVANLAIAPGHTH